MRIHGRLRHVLAGLSLAALAACGGSGGNNGNAGPIVAGPGDVLRSTPPEMLALKQPQSCDAFRSYVSESIADLILNIGVIACPGCAVSVGGGAQLAAAAGTDAQSFDAFTGTNSQEAGVDEIDHVEVNAGGYFFLIDGRHLVVADGLPPADLNEVASLELKQDGYIEGLLLDADNDRLVVVASEFSFFDPLPLSILPPSRPNTELLFIDVADPTNPVIERRLSIEGFKLAVRRIGNRIHAVAHTTPPIPTTISSSVRLLGLRQDLANSIASNNGTVQANLESEIRDLVNSLVAATDPDEFLPDITLHVGGQSTSVGSPVCADVAIPDVTMPFALTSVTSIDSDGSNVSSLKVANNSWNVYASEQHVYLTQTSGGWWFADRQRQQTAIHKIAVGAGAPRSVATGVVDGWAGSSFQYSEHRGFLRVVTSRSEFDPAVRIFLRDHSLYVLEDDGVGSLEVVGSERGFGAMETIFSARLVGDRGFVVTFRQIDPLFTFDLSDPVNPQLVGELEIPGVSTYIHPLGDTHLLTIGYDGNDTRLNGDFAVSIFDVQRLDDPRLVHRFVPVFDKPGFAWTPAVWDHLAFNYFDEAGTLTIPLQYSASSWDDHFSGFLALSIDTIDGISELGRLDHSDLARAVHCTGPNALAPSLCDSGVYLEAATPRRSVSALFGSEPFIYTLSNLGMKVSAADDFANPVAVLPLPYRNEYPWF